jgi:SAM-dependent methyltransferase
MLINSSEYQAMFDTEEKLWWYKILHEKVLTFIRSQQLPKDIKILDAGCGTGGLMAFLRNNGYNHCKGFDFSEDAVSLAGSRGFDVSRIDITKISEFFTGQTFDIIICNDVLYQFEDDEISGIFQGLFSKLSSDGFLISNNNAFEVFSGTHDIAVGSKKRFRLDDFISYSKTSGVFGIHNHTYWSLFLSPLILLIRSIQRLQIRLKLADFDNIKSDVEMPSPFINSILYNIVKFEEKLFKRAPFGSSLFLILKKT